MTASSKEPKYIANIVDLDEFYDIIDNCEILESKTQDGSVVKLCRHSTMRLIKAIKYPKENSGIILRHDGN